MTVAVLTQHQGCAVCSSNGLIVKAVDCDCVTLIADCMLTVQMPVTGRNSSSKHFAQQHGTVTHTQNRFEILHHDAGQAQFGAAP